MSGCFTVYPFGVNRVRLEHAIRGLQLNAVLVLDLEGADAVITIKNYYLTQAEPLRDAEASGIPIWVLRSNTQALMEEALLKPLAGTLWAPARRVCGWRRAIHWRKRRRRFRLCWTTPSPSISLRRTRTFGVSNTNSRSDTTLARAARGASRTVDARSTSPNGVAGAGGRCGVARKLDVLGCSRGAPGANATISS